MIKSENNSTVYNTDDLNAFIESIYEHAYRCSLITEHSKNEVKLNRSNNDITHVGYVNRQKQHDIHEDSYNPKSSRCRAVFVKYGTRGMYGTARNYRHILQIVKPDHLWQNTMDQLASATSKFDESAGETAFVMPVWAKRELFVRVANNICRLDTNVQEMKLLGGSTVSWRTDYFFHVNSIYYDHNSVDDGTDGYGFCPDHKNNQTHGHGHGHAHGQEHDRITYTFINSLPDIRIMKAPAGKPPKGGIMAIGRMTGNLQELRYRSGNIAENNAKMHEYAARLRKHAMSSNCNPTVLAEIDQIQKYIAQHDADQKVIRVLIASINDTMRKEPQK